MRNLLLPLLCFGLLRFVAAQQSSLTATSGYVLPSEWNHALYLPVRCDGNGNFYLREYESGMNASPVLKVTRKADNLIRFSLDSVSDLKGASVQDFAVTTDGTVYQLLQFGDDVIITESSADGRIVGQTKLERQFWPAHFTPLSGNRGFLVMGSELPQKGGPPPKFVTFIFDASGRLVRDLKLSQDEVENKKEETGKNQKGGPLANESMLPLVLGDIQSDNAGRLFILRASDPAVIFVVDSSGRLQRTLKAIPPESGMTVGAMQVSNGLLALLFQKGDDKGQIIKRTMVVLDSSTGRKNSEYAVPATFGTAFACYTGESFGFVTTTPGGKLALQTAKPE